MKALAFLLTLLVGSTAWADAAPTTLVLIVASNRGAALDRRPLQYADDDGAKYHQVFASLAGESNTTLLTDFDADSARLFPALARLVRPPTRPQIESAMARLAQQARKAHQEGQSVQFYFVFAGHGDVDQGRGFLELADGPFTSDDLDSLLRRIGADESHVILDSCNSFFVINPRKPGGRRFATPHDAAERLAHSLPNVGVFLSTSSEAEVFEWSELQSGVFSHAVRSGLMGAADANHDGRVSYEELAGFVETSAAEIKNPVYRPKIYARGPNGRDASTLFDASRTRAINVSITDDASMRLTARDRDGVRWLDAHKEAGQILDLRLPLALLGRLDFEKLTASGEAAGTVEGRYEVPADSQVTLAQLTPAASASAPRGAQEIFRGLFVRPFGPRALAQYRDQRSNSPEPVYGISRENAARMSLLLEQLQSAERQQRLFAASISVATAAAYGTYFGLALREPGLEHGEKVGLAIGGGAVTGLSLVAGLVRTFHTSERERLFENFRREISEPGADQTQVAAHIETRLQEIQEEEHNARRLKLTVMYIFTGLGAAITALNEFGDNTTHDYRLINRGLSVAITATALAVTLKEQFTTSATDKLIDLWRRDPHSLNLHLDVAALPGGGVVGISGSF